MPASTPSLTTPERRPSRVEHLADEILEIADDSSRDYKEKTGADDKVTWVADREHIARQRLRIATCKKDLGPDGAQKVRQPLRRA
jgi:hypothetical protein